MGVKLNSDVGFIYRECCEELNFVVKEVGIVFVFCGFLLWSYIYLDVIGGSCNLSDRIRNKKGG